MSMVLRDSSLKPTTVCDKKSDNSKENTDDSLKQHQMTDTKTSSFESPLKLDKDWKEKFFYPANHVSEVEPKKVRKNNDALIIEDSVSDDEEEVESPVACKREKQNVLPSSKKNFVPKAVLMKTGMRPVNAAKPKAAYNGVKINRFTVVKASASLGLDANRNRVVDQCSQKHKLHQLHEKSDYIDAQGRFKSVMAWVPKRR
ncbi:hypothetical protein Tco_0939987 [Tanacetum coccineum]|uniref:Uncharacterized protein n=1 Tax=Tanacetum coccineum TaxID=301880 RepID=A0ABQ5DM46_9ASTR